MYVVSRKQAGNDRSPRQPSAPNNLPTQVTPLIGREQEARAACDMLAEPTLRLLTVIGPPGIGKTRLALCVASMAGPQFPHGIYFVPLSTVSDPDLVVPSIAGVFGLKEGSASTLRDHLVMHLRDRKMLLLLDNFEQVSGAAPVLAELLEDAPDLKALVTSRTVLHIYGERSFPVPPLKVPEADTDWATETPPPIGADEVAAYEAVALFVQRARTVKPDFELTPSNAPVVAEICRRLEGVPLSIELAAARMRVLTPRAILERLSQPLLLLRGGPHNLPARQQTLNDAIAWSYTLLDEDEQRLFRRLSVFVGGCTLEAIENVVVDVEGTAYAATHDTDRRMPAERSCLDLVESLLGKSLLQPEEVAGEPRFAMLDTICEYARERLEETDEVDTIRGAHAAYYARLAEQVAMKLEGPEQADWIERLEADRGNLRAALKWFAASPGEGHAVSGLGGGEGGGGGGGGGG
jgi:predicted ATPase